MAAAALPEETGDTRDSDDKQVEDRSQVRSDREAPSKETEAYKD